MLKEKIAFLFISYSIVSICCHVGIILQFLFICFIVFSKIKYYIINRILNYLSFLIFVFSITFISQEAVAGLVFDASNMVLRFGSSNASASENTTIDNTYAPSRTNGVKTNSDNIYPAYAENNTQMREQLPIFTKPAEIKVNSTTPEKRRVYFDENDDEEYMPVKKQPVIASNDKSIASNSDIYTPQNTIRSTANNSDNYPTYAQQNIAKPQIVTPIASNSDIYTPQNTIRSTANNSDNYPTYAQQNISRYDPVTSQQAKTQIITPVASNTEDLIFAKPKKYDDEIIVSKYSGVKIIPVPTRKPKQEYYCDYEIKPADNLSIIGKHFNVNSDEIAIAMGVKKTDKLEVGKLYRIPVLSYYVLDGDSIDTIAKKYNIKSVEIKNINIGVAKIIQGNIILLPIIDKTKIDISSLQSVNTQEVVSRPLFMWPTSGIVSLSSFKDSNVKNDGIIVTTSVHNPVVAIANGVVAYVGNKIKSYGNMIIIKHDGGYVSVYGYTEDVLVQKNDVVIVGQAIANTSNSKLTNQPVLYFSLRKNKEILDPLKYLPEKR
jgi:murein DD-endopeptidase MepM/ murein hydrolase activator NlpD